MEVDEISTANIILGTLEVMEKHWICAVCLSTTNVSPLPPLLLTWLEKNVSFPSCAPLPSETTSFPSINKSIPGAGTSLPSNTSLPSINRSFLSLDATFYYGACVLCAGALRRAVKLVHRATRAQNLLRGLKTSGELSLKTINSANIGNSLIPLSTVNLGTDCYNYEYVYEEKTTVILKTEVEVVNVKNETWSDVEYDSDGIRNSEKSSDEAEKSETLADLKRKKLAGTKKEKLPVTKNKKLLEKNKKLPVTKKGALKRPKTLSEAKRLQMETDKKLEKYFKIEKLTVEEQKAELLKAKESKNYKNSYLKCDLCYKGFADVSAFERHKLRHTEIMGRYKCNICQLYCSELARHVNENHKYKFSCKECGIVIKNRTSATSHATFHEGKKFVCDICGQVFSHKSTHLSHVRIKHPSEEHVCRLCGFSFINERGLRFHKSRQHRLEDDEIPEDGPRCVDCDISFKASSALHTHERVSPRHGDVVRNDSSRFPHPGSGWGCGRGHRRQPRQPPSRRRRREEVIICEECGQPQANQALYRAHFSKQHPLSPRAPAPAPGEPRPRLCTLCGRTFKSVQMLHNHARCHAPKFECDVCHKRFTAAASLTTHTNIHTGEKNYPCELCGRSFNHVANQRRHVATVHSQIRVQCEFCEKCFKSKYELDAHVKHVHLKVPYPKRKRPRSGKTTDRRSEVPVSAETT